MKLIVGLGNPGEKFIGTRHNTGFRVVEKFRKQSRFPEFHQEKKFRSLISKDKKAEEKIVLAQPQTFMNKSGLAVKKMVQFYSLSLQDLVVVHDDADIEIGSIKIVRGKGAAGHKGVNSIIKQLGSNNFIRFRVGIEPEDSSRLNQKGLEKFVLKNFTKKEEKAIKESVQKSVQALEFFLENGLGKTMNKFNRNQP